MKSFFLFIALLFTLTITDAQTKMFINKGGLGTDSIALNDIVNITFKTVPTPTGKGIVFISNRSGADEVWFVKEDGTALSKLTNGGGTSKMYPRWSPMGDKIAYSGLISGIRKIFVIKADGTPLDTITTSNPVTTYGMCWSGDGNSIWYTEAITCGERIRKINVVTKKDTLIIDDSGVQQDPDEKNGMLAYRNGACAANATVNLFNILTNSKSALTNLQENAEAVRWNHIGSSIVFQGGGSTESRIITVNSDGTSKNKILTGMGAYPDFTSNENIIFSRYKNDIIVSGAFFNLWVMDLTGGNLKQLTTGDYTDLYPDAF